MGAPAVGSSSAKLVDVASYLTMTARVGWKIGKHVNYLYERLKLLELPANARKALGEQRIGIRVASAIARMVRALREYDVAGIRTNVTFFRQILEDAEFRAGRLHTGFVEEFLERRKPFAPAPELEQIAARVAAHHARGSAAHREAPPAARSHWREAGRAEMLR